MKTLREIYDFLDSISPFGTQESWDNSGVLLGKMDAKIPRIFLSLEATAQIAQDLPPDSLLITHHPLIFKPLKNLCADFYPCNILEILMRKNIALIALHTNFDLSHLNESFVKEILGFTRYTRLESPNHFVIKLHFGDSLQNLADILRQKLGDCDMRITRAGDFVNDIFVVCGAGISAISENLVRQGDCIITGDVKYHDAMRFLSLQTSIIDVGHYHSERHFGTILQKNLKKIGYNAIISVSQNPFTAKENL